MNLFSCAAIGVGAPDHATYLGIDVENGQCAENPSVYNAYNGAAICLRPNPSIIG